MAFNPFTYFRRHQKVIFALLAIVCMFVFILSFGAGDFFTWAQAYFATPRNQGSVVATLYGTKVHEGDLRRTQDHRQLASEFLIQVLARKQSQVSTMERTIFGGGRMIPAAGEKIRQLHGAIGSAAMMTLARAEERSRRGPPQTLQQQRETEAAIRADLDSLRNVLLFDRTADGKSAYLALEQDLRAPLEDLLSYLQFELYRDAVGSNYPDMVNGFFNPQTLNANRTFFLGGERTTEGMLDFKIWTEQAEKLGIHPSESAVLRLALTFAGWKALPPNPTFATNPTVKEFLANRRERERVTPEELAAALRAEIRVALARQALTGRQAAGTFPAIALDLLPTTPAQSSAAEGFAEFTRLTTTANAALLEIPVEAFLAEVKDQPTETALRALFDKYKNDEPHPDRSRPAFKQPRQAQVQYLQLSGTSPFIQKQAREARAASEAIVPLGLALGAGFAHGGVPASLLAIPATVQAMQPDSMLTDTYTSYKNSNANSLASWLEYENAFGQKYGMHDSSWMRVGPTPRLVGHLMASLHNGSGTPVGALSDWAANVWVYEHGDRAYYERKLTPAVLAATVPQGALYSGLALALLEQKKELPQPVPLAVVAPTFRKQQIERLTDRIRVGLMRDTYEKVRSLRGKTEAEAAPVLTAFLKERGIEGSLVSTPYAMDEFDLRKSPAMDGLIQLAQRFESLGQPKPPAADLAMSLALGTQGTFDPVRWSPNYAFYQMEAQRTLRNTNNPAAVMEMAASANLGDPDSVLVWRSEDRSAQVPATLDSFVWDRGKRVKVREKVAEAWRHEAAQSLAMRHAEKLRDHLQSVKSKQEVAASMQWLLEQKPGVVKELRGIGRLVGEPSTIPGNATYIPGTIPPDVIASPRSDTIEQLMSGFKDKGDAVVVSDLPVKHWYVALCQARTEPSETAYLNAQKATKRVAASGVPFSWPFYTAHLVPLDEVAFEEKLLSQMRREAVKEESLLDTRGRWRIPADLRVNFARSDTLE